MLSAISNVTFRPLVSLGVLNLGYNSLSSLPADTFQSQARLTRLDLSWNNELLAGGPLTSSSFSGLNPQCEIIQSSLVNRQYLNSFNSTREI